MTDFYFNSDPKKLPQPLKGIHPVHIFDLHPLDKHNNSWASRSIVARIRKLGVKVSDEAFDFVTIATAVTAAESFELRSNALNNWSRELHLHIPVINVEKWMKREEEDGEKVQETIDIT